MLLLLPFLFLLLDNVSGSLEPRVQNAPKVDDPECTVTNPVTNEFFDLRPLIRKEADKSRSQSWQCVDSRDDWHISGYDYRHNFTLNICEPVLSDYSDVVGVSDKRNVSGFYVDSDGKISIGYIY